MSIKLSCGGNFKQFKLLGKIIVGNVFGGNFQLRPINLAFEFNMNRSGVHQIEAHVLFFEKLCCHNCWLL